MNDEDKDHSLDDKPRISTLSTHLVDLVNWEVFAVQLPGIKYPDTQKIIRENPGSIENQKLALYAKWLQVHPDASWKDVATALKKAADGGGEVKFAAQIRKLNLKQVYQSHNDEMLPSTAREFKLLDRKEEEIDVINSLQKFRDRFNFICLNTKHAIDKIKSKLNKKKLRDFLFSMKLRLPKALRDLETIQDVINLIVYHTDFLDGSILNEIIKEICTVARKSQSLKEEIASHIQLVKTFKEKHEIRELNSKLGGEEIRQNQTNVIFKLINVWETQKINLVECFLKNLLGLKPADEMRWISVKSGSVKIAVAIPAEFEHEAIINCSQQKILADLMGVISIQIGEHTVIEENGRVEYTFETALMEASMVGNIKAIELILEIGITVDHTDDQGRTPLMIASENGHGEIVKRLQAHAIRHKIGHGTRSNRKFNKAQLQVIHDFSVGTRKHIIPDIGKKKMSQYVSRDKLMNVSQNKSTYSTKEEPVTTSENVDKSDIGN